VPDVSGFLGLVDPDAWLMFVARTLDQVFAHFRSEMGKRTLLVWATGLSTTWR
jgi:hypothetical protein